jgi:hypothetical protein
MLRSYRAAASTESRRKSDRTGRAADRQGAPATITAIHENNSRGLPSEDAQIVEAARRLNACELEPAQGAEVLAT